MSQTLKIKDVVIEKSTRNGQPVIRIVSPRPSSDIEIKGNIERFAETFIKYLETKASKKDGNPMLSFSNNEERINAISSLVDFLLSKPEEQDFEIEIQEEKPEAEETQQTQEQVLEVPLTKYTEKKELKEGKKEETTEIDMTEIMERFNQLKAVNIPRDRILEIISDEKGIAIDALERIIPIVPKAEVKPIKVEKKEVVSPNTVTVKQTVTPQVSKSESTVTTEKFDIKKVPGYGYLSPTLIDGLRQLADRVYHKSVEELVQMYLEEAKKLPVTSDTTWLNLAFRDLYQHNIIKVVKEKVHYLLFYINEDGVKKPLPVLADRRISGLYINRCYELPELEKAGRLVGMSMMPTDINNYPDLPKITQVKPIGDLPADIVPKAHEVYQAIPLAEIMKKAREEPTKRVEEAFYATIIGINQWQSEDGCYVVVYDGSDVPMYSTKITLRYENPYGIDESDILNAQGRQVLCYGIIRYQEPDERFPERLNVFPIYLAFVD